MTPRDSLAPTTTSPRSFAKSLSLKELFRFHVASWWSIYVAAESFGLFRLSVLSARE